MVLLNYEQPKPGPERSMKVTGKNDSGRRGELSPMGLRKWWLLIPVLPMQVAASHSDALGIPLSVAPWLVSVSYTMLILGSIANRHLWGFRFFLVGSVLNITVMALNEWRMPITPTALLQAGFPLEASQESGSHLSSIKSILLLREETRAWFLSDIIVIPQIRRVFSIGDFIIICSAVVAILEIVLAMRKPPAKSGTLAPEKIAVE